MMSHTVDGVDGVIPPRSLDQRSVANNLKSLSYARAFLSILIGCAAGILGLEGTIQNLVLG